MYFTILTISLVTMSSANSLKQKTFINFPLLQDLNISEAVISRSEERTVTECGRSCTRLMNCESFFYNTVTAECQHHGTVFTSSDAATNETGVRYYYMIKNLNDLCPTEKGFQLLTNTGPCVKFQMQKKSWSTQNKICMSYSQDSRLAVLDTQVKYQLVKNAGLAIDNQFSNGLWIGLSEYRQGEYRWVNGANITFTRWSFLDWSSPSAQDCVYMNRNQKWKWVRRSCKGPFHAVCEIPLS